MLDNSLRSIPIVGSWAAPLITGGNKHNLALLRSHLEKTHTLDASAAAPQKPDGLGVFSSSSSGQAQEARRGHEQWVVWPLAQGLWSLGQGVIMVVTWPIRRLPMWGLLLCVVLAPLAVGAVAVGAAVWFGLRRLGLV